MKTAKEILEQALEDRWCAASNDQCLMLEKAIFQALAALDAEEQSDER